MIPGRAALLLAFAPLLSGCPAEGDLEQKPPRPDEPGAEPSWNPQVKRPPWQFFLEKTGERCVVLRVDDGEHITRIEETACPIDMEIGEKLRLAGSVCVREGGSQARAIPVVCPDPLTNAEKDFLDKEQAEGRLPKPSPSR